MTSSNETKSENKEKITKKLNTTDADLETLPQSTKYPKPSNKADEDEFWKDCLKHNLDKDIRPSQ